MNIATQWTMEEMVQALLDSPILLKAAEDIPIPLVPVEPYPVSREMLNKTYNAD